MEDPVKTPGDGESVVFRWPPLRSVAPLLASALLVLVFEKEAAGRQIADRIIGIVGLAYFGGLVGRYLARAVTRPAVLTLSPAGLTPMKGLLRRRPQFIPWNEILGLQIFRWGIVRALPATRMLALDLSETSSRNARNPYDRFNKYLTGSVVTLGERLFAVELEAVADVILRFSPELAVRHSGARFTWHRRVRSG